VEPLHVAMWGIPTAIAAFIIHAWRLRRLDQALARELDGKPEVPTVPSVPATQEGR